MGGLPPQDEQANSPPQPESDSKGRTYLLQESLSEPARLRMQHEVIKDAMGGRLILAPVDMSRPGLRILDSATTDGSKH